MSGYFKVISKVKLHELDENTKLPESDFAAMSGEHFVQLKYHEEEVKYEPYKVKPGTWTIHKTSFGISLKPTEFSNDKLLDSFVHTENITSKIDKFYSRLEVYKRYGIEVPKRTMLLWGPAGTGKSSAITKVAQKYAALGDIAVIIWKTDVIDPHDVKEFVKSFEYHGVNRLLFIAEDLGGVEVDQARIKSESSLLSLLDNQEKAFAIPVMMVVTTNYPANLLANLTNRPGRIDDKVEVGYPNSQQRQDLFKFYAELAPGSPSVSEEDLERIGLKKYIGFTPAHLKELFVRSGIYEISYEEAMIQIAAEIVEFNKMFEKKASLGIKNDDY